MKSEKYQYVYIKPFAGKIYYQARVGEEQQCFQKERDAAKHADKLLIQLGRSPVNILKPKV